MPAPGPGRGSPPAISSFIGIEAENQGIPADPWPAVAGGLLQAKGCAAILKKLGADVEMCIGHKEWAPRRKIDPSFDMNAFRARRRRDHGRRRAPAPPPAPAPAPAPAPPHSGGGRPTLRLGDRGEAVKTVQAKVGVLFDGITAGNSGFIGIEAANQGIAADPSPARPARFR